MYAPRMPRIPELHIVFDADMNPVSASCRMCGSEVLDLGEEAGVSAKDKIKRLAALFDIHMMGKHIDQYEVRSVRKIPTT